MRRAGFLLVGAAVCGVLAGQAEAGVSVSPSRVVIRGKPGQKLAGEFHVKNAGHEPITVTVEPEDWTDGAKGARGSVSWLTVKPTQFELARGKSRKVKYTVRVPEETQGEVRAQVFFTSMITGAQGMRSRLGAILYVSLKGTERVEAAIGAVEVRYTAATPGIHKPDRLDVAVRIQNRSNVHIIPEGKAVFKDADGRVAATALLPRGWGLLPQEEDLYHAIVTGVYMRPGRYTLEIAIRCGDDVQQPIALEKTLPATLSPQYEWTLEEPPAATP